MTDHGLTFERRWSDRLVRATCACGFEANWRLDDILAMRDYRMHRAEVVMGPPSDSAA